MALTEIQAVRLKSSDQSVITRNVTTATGTTSVYKLEHQNILATPAIEIRANGSLLTEGLDYTVDLVHGIVEMTIASGWASAPQGTKFDFTYYWSVFSDEEVQYFLDESGANITIATARLLLAWAADAAKLAKRYTLSGGGGLGQVVNDTSVAAKELRATAKALVDQEVELGESIPAEGLTEIPWTEQLYNRQRDQHFIRES